MLLFCHTVSLYWRKYNSIHRHNKNTAFLTPPNSIISGFNTHNWEINAKIKVEVYLRPKISSYCLHESMSLRQFVCVPTFVQIGRGLCGTRTKCNFGTSKCTVCIASVFTNLQSYSDFTRRLTHRTSPSSIKKYKFIYTLSNVHFHKLHPIPAIL